MSLPKLAIEQRAVTYFVVFLILVGGIFSFFQLGWLEDPDFSVKSAVVVTPYPGASALEVEQEVTDRIEKALQEMGQLKEIFSSTSYRGMSVVQPRMNDKYDATI